jgi:hypothetical protein
LAATAPAAKPPVEKAVEKDAEPRQPADESVFASDEELGERADLGIPSEVESFRRDLIAKVGRSSPLLGSGLVSSLTWSLDESRLLITFRNAMEENIVRSELPLLVQVASTVAGRALKVEVRVDGAKNPRAGQAQSGDEKQSDAAAIVERMFRGQRIERKQGEGTR